MARALDRIESERAGRDHLVGDRFTVADLTAAALLYPLVWPPEFPYELPEPPDPTSSNRLRATPRSTGSRRPGGATEGFRRHLAHQPSEPGLSLERALDLLGDPAAVVGAQAAGSTSSSSR